MRYGIVVLVSGVLYAGTANEGLPGVEDGRAHIPDGAVVKRIGDDTLEVTTLVSGKGCKKPQPVTLGLSCKCEQGEGACRLTYDDGEGTADCGGATCCEWVTIAGERLDAAGLDPQ